MTSAIPELSAARQAPAIGSPEAGRAAAEGFGDVLRDAMGRGTGGEPGQSGLPKQPGGEQAGTPAVASAATQPSAEGPDEIPTETELAQAEAERGSWRRALGLTAGLVDGSVARTVETLLGRAAGGSGLPQQATATDSAGDALGTSDSIDADGPQAQVGRDVTAPAAQAGTSTETTTTSGTSGTSGSEEVEPGTPVARAVEAGQRSVQAVVESAAQGAARVAVEAAATGSRAAAEAGTTQQSATAPAAAALPSAAAGATTATTTGEAPAGAPAADASARTASSPVVAVPTDATGRATANALSSDGETRVAATTDSSASRAASAAGASTSAPAAPGAAAGSAVPTGVSTTTSGASTVAPSAATTAVLPSGAPTAALPAGASSATVPSGTSAATPASDGSTAASGAATSGAAASVPVGVAAGGSSTDSVDAPLAAARTVGTTGGPTTPAGPAAAAAVASTPTAATAPAAAGAGAPAAAPNAVGVTTPAADAPAATAPDAEGIEVRETTREGRTPSVPARPETAQAATTPVAHLDAEAETSEDGVVRVTTAPASETRAAAADLRGDTRGDDGRQGRETPRTEPAQPTAVPDRGFNAAATAPVVAGVAPVAGAAASAPPLHAQITQALGPMLRGGDGNHQVTIVLAPEHLGRVRIEVAIRGGEVSVIMQAADGQARDLLKDNLDQLRAALAEMGLQAGDLDVDSGGADADERWQHLIDHQAAVRRRSRGDGTGFDLDSPTPAPAAGTPTDGSVRL